MSEPIQEIHIRPAGHYGQIEVIVVGRENVQVTGYVRDQAQVLFFGIRGIIETIEADCSRLTIERGES